MKLGPVFTYTLGNKHSNFRKVKLSADTFWVASLAIRFKGPANVHHNYCNAEVGIATLCYAEVGIATLCYADVGIATLCYAEVDISSLYYAEVGIATLYYAQVGTASL